MAHKIQWGNFWLNTIDGLVRLYCRYYHRLSPLSKLSLPTQGSALLVANHISGLDPLLMVCASSRPLRFLIAREEYEKPLLKCLYHAMGCIPVDRSSRPEIALRAALRALEAGEVIALFPQGRIILPNAQQKPLKRGVIWLAKQTQTPIYAMHIQGVVGMGKIMPALFQRSHVQLQVHEAMHCAQADCLESLQKKLWVKSMSNTLYPEIKPYSTFHLSVSSLHSLYVEESGNPEGLPVVFLHGGPGAGCDANHRRYFDPKDYRIILFDQRGCGRSTPHAALQDNTTQALISDIEAIREHLNIQQWVVAGGSWGTTLGLAYAQTYPQQVLGLILRGIFLCRQADLDWLYGAGTRCFFPQEWQAFVEFLPSALSDDVIAGYYQLVTSDDAQMRLKAARAWATWEGRPATLLPNAALVGHLCEEKLALSLARISTHYFTQHCFLHNQQLLTDIGRIQNIPGMIVHGRYDMLCPVDNAWILQKNWPKANLDIVADAGHSAGEPGIIRGLIKAANNMAGMLSG